MLRTLHMFPDHTHYFYWYFTLKYQRFTSVFRVNSNVLYTFQASWLENASVFKGSKDCLGEFLHNRMISNGL